MNLETSSFESDPSYDIERLTGSEEKTAERISETTASTVPIVHVSIPEYIFDSSTNPFAYDADNPQPIDAISMAIDAALKNHFVMDKVIIRGVQSAHHNLSRQDLIESIVNNGSDLHTNPGNTTEIYARGYDSTAINSIIGGFHIWKPKSDDRPQYPVDVWMIFDKKAFDNIEYIHPRHNVIANDKWLLKDNDNHGLKGLLVIN